MRLLIREFRVECGRYAELENRGFGVLNLLGRVRVRVAVAVQHYF